MTTHLSPDAMELWARGLSSSEVEKNHMDGCLECAKEVQNLKVYFTTLKALAPKSAPTGFSQRLLTRVQLESEKPWWHKQLFAMFFPMRIKVPLQLAGAGFAAALLFWALPLYNSSNNELSAVSEIEILDSVEEEESSAIEPLAAFQEKPKLSENEKEEIKSAKIPTPEPPLPPVPDEMVFSKEKVVRQPATVPSQYATNNSGMSAISDDHVAIIESRNLQKPVAKTNTKPHKKMAMLRQDKSSQSLASADLLSSKAEMAQEQVTDDSLLKSLGFSKQGEFYRLQTTKVIADSLKLALNKAGYQSRFTLKQISPDSVEIDVK